MKKLPYTPRSRVRSALRRLWLTSRERAAALKAAGYACEECGAKRKDCTLEVHHMDEVLNWDTLIDYVYRHLLCSPDRLEVLCKECHQKLHLKQ